MKLDELQIEVLADGTIKSTSNKIGQANHQNAEAFLKELARLVGGPTVTQKIGKAHHHRHEHEHAHEGHSH